MATSEPIFGRYQINAALGRGGFATVYRAHDPLLGRDVALKALLPHLAGDEGIRVRFLAEARAIAGLRHPNIVTIYDVGDGDSGPFFAMELIEGQTLAATVAGGQQLALPRVAEILRSLASAVDYLHGAGIIHRDIKPANVMIDAGGSVVLMDFGIARSIGQSGVTLPGISIGTPEAMAPEQVLGDEIGPAVDIYALGVLVYRLLAGRPPFSGEHARVLHAQAFEPPPPLPDLRPDLPTAVYAAVDAALAKDPALRPVTAAAFAAALDGATESAASAAPPTRVLPAGPITADEERETAFTPVPRRTPTPPFQQAAVAPPATRGSRLPLIAGVGIAVLLLGAGGAAFAISRNGGTPHDQPSPSASAAVAAASITPAASASAVVTASAARPSATPSATTSVVASASSTLAPTKPPAATAAPATTTAPPTPSATARPTPSPAPTVSPALAALRSELAALPGTASASVVLPDGTRADQDADRQQPAGGVIGLWIAAAFLEAENAKHVSLAETYTIKASDQASGTGILGGPDSVGKVVNYGQILDALLINSDNTAANLLINKLGGMQPVNDYAKVNGYGGTLLQRLLGKLDPAHENYTTARDAAAFFSNLERQRVVSATASKRIADDLAKRRGQEDSSLDFFGRSLPSSVVYKHASGVLTGVRNDAGSFAARGGGAVVVAVLLSTLPSETGGEDAIAHAVASAYATAP